MRRILVLSVLIAVVACGGANDPAPPKVTFTHESAALAAEGEAQVDVSDQTMGRLMWDQITSIGETVQGKAKQSLIVSRDDTIYMGGIPFPFNDAVPKYRPGLSQELFAGRALGKSFCKDVLAKLQIGAADDAAIGKLSLYLLGERPTPKDLEDLRAVAGAGNAKFSGMELVCTALIGDAAFSTL